MKLLTKLVNIDIYKNKLRLMDKKNTISVKSLNQAMKSSNQRAIRTNKALGLDTVYVKGGHVIREHADGSKSTIKKLDNSSSRSYTIKGPIKIS